MVFKRLITDLPAELRQQIFSEYFKVEGGYAYNAESEKLRNAADNTPIDFSLMYTCRSIANDCKQLPLAANTIHFSTVYREDWCRLAGCFNLAATYYRVLQEDFAMHLAYLITPEMYEQIKGEFPGFRSKFDEAKRVHAHIWHGIDDASSAEWLHHANTGDPGQQSKCGFVTSFLCETLLDPMESLHTYRGYAQVDRRVWFHQRGERLFHPFEDIQDRWDILFNHFDDTASGEVYRSLHQLLALIADQNPEEFAKRVYLYMPHWRGKYPAQDFLHMRLGRELWAMPSRSELSDFLERLGIDEFVWNLPGLWKYRTDFYWNLGHTFGRAYNAEHHMNPPVDFDLRIHEKIRFSAAAVAIRFIGLLPYHHRMQLRMVSIYEDLPAVNLQSFHGQGLVPLLKENTKAKIERRVSVVDSMMNLYRDTDFVQNVESRLLHEPRFNTVDQRFVPNLSCWLLDALSVADAGIPSKSFSLLLDSGPYADACTEVFEQLVHGSIARAKAWEHHVQANLIQGIPEKGIRNIALMFSYASEVGFEDAVMKLANESSAVLRCNFNPGLPRNPQWIVNKVNDKCTELRYEFAYKGWGNSTLLGPVKLPNDLNDVDSVARVCAIQSGDEYQKSQGRHVPYVRTVDDMIRLKKARCIAGENV